MFKSILQHIGLAKPSTAKYEVDTITGTYFATAKFIGIFDPTRVENYVCESVDGVISLRLLEIKH
jgi:hypothetical protein